MNEVKYKMPEGVNKKRIIHNNNLIIGEVPDKSKLEISKPMKVWLYTLYTIFSLAIIVGFIYMAIQTGNAYRIVYTEIGLKGILLSFVIGVIFYSFVFYGIYRLDLKVRKKINESNIK